MKQEVKQDDERSQAGKVKQEKSDRKTQKSQRRYKLLRVAALLNLRECFDPNHSS